MKSRYILTSALIGILASVIRCTNANTSAIAQEADTKRIEERPFIHHGHPNHALQDNADSWILGNNIKNWVPEDSTESWIPKDRLGYRQSESKTENFPTENHDATHLERYVIQAIARKSTVLVQSKEDPTLLGSGVIVAKEGNTYVVLTAAHVLGVSGDYTVTTNNETSHAVKNIQKFANIDLARFQFESDENLEVASLGNSEQLKRLDPVQLAGFPKSEQHFNPVLSITKGEITAISETPGLDGYSIIYNNPSSIGMSGGPVFDQYGHVIAIHGRQESNHDGTVPYHGSKLGIPISLYRQAITDIEQWQLNSSSSYAGMRHIWVKVRVISQRDLELARQTAASLNNMPEENEKASKKLEEEAAQLKKVRALNQKNLKETIRRVQTRKERKRRNSPSWIRLTQKAKPKHQKSQKSEAKSRKQTAQSEAKPKPDRKNTSKAKAKVKAISKSKSKAAPKTKRKNIAKAKLKAKPASRHNSKARYKPKTKTIPKAKNKANHNPRPKPKSASKSRDKSASKAKQKDKKK